MQENVTGARQRPGRAAPRLGPDELCAALTGTLIEARYQPIVRLADRVPVALEALARLNHPSRGTLLPHRFVPQMEDAGLAQLLTRRVSQRAFTDMAGPALAPLGLDMALNFPLDVLQVPEALALLDEQRREAGIPAGRVVIELTESRPVQRMVALRRGIERLRALGYGVSIDDVSPAVQQLPALLDLPFSALKLDKGLVSRLQTDEAARDFSQRVVGMARSRGLTVTAEGVANTAIWHRLAALGVDLAQGFLVARPLQAADVPAWLCRWRKRRRFG